MTTLGKVLAILNLVLSIFVGALIVMSYVARTNWHSAYVQMKKHADSAIADRQAYFDEGVKLKGEVATAEQNLAKANQEKEAVVKEQQATVATLNQRLAGEQQRSQAIQASMTSLTSELERRQREVNYLGSLVAQRDEQLKTFERRAQDNQNRAVEQEMYAKSEHQKNLALLSKIEEQAKAIQKSERQGQLALTTPSAPTTNPPQADIQGVITKTDSGSGLVTVGIGSDAGLAKGNTLEVYRLNPEPKYLGTLEILAVRPNEAVGKQAGAYHTALHIGDRVSSSIITRR